MKDISDQDLKALQSKMAETQLVSRGITDKRVLDAMRDVPRHEFVPDDSRHYAYDDSPLPIGAGQTISQPYMVAIMTECLGLEGGEKVLEVGTGSGYQAAILSKLAEKVISIERVASLAKKAEENLKKLEILNVDVVVGDGTLGYEKEAPYDAIIVTAGCPDVPRPLIEQLKDGGKLVLPVGDRFQQILTKITRTGGQITGEESIPCTFVPLLGKFGWK